MQKEPLKTITEFNKDLALLSVRVDALQDSFSIEKLNQVNEVLIQFVQLHLKDQDFGDINFLIGLLKMLHCFPNDLSTILKDIIPNILKSLDCTDIKGLKTPKEAIYDYIVDINIARRVSYIRF